VPGGSPGRPIVPDRLPLLGGNPVVAACTSWHGVGRLLKGFARQGARTGICWPSLEKPPWNVTDAIPVKNRPSPMPASRPNRRSEGEARSMYVSPHRGPTFRTFCLGGFAMVTTKRAKLVACCSSLPPCGWPARPSATTANPLTSRGRRPFVPHVVPRFSTCPERGSSRGRLMLFSHRSRPVRWRSEVRGPAPLQRAQCRTQ